MTVASDPPPASTRPVLSCGLAILLLGAGYAFPSSLCPADGAWTDWLPDAVRNLYALTVWLGLAHFVFAYRGQARGRPRPLYWLALAAAAGALIAAQRLLGWERFSFLAWIWFIAHFIASERRIAAPGPGTRLAYYQVVVAFAWFNAALYDLGGLQEHRLILYAGSLVLAASGLAAGGWSLLAADRVRLPLLSLVLVAEALVWGTYGPWMSPGFRAGVYVFHIAAASFYHYLSTWFHGHHRAPADPWLSPGGIMAVAAACIGCGWAIAHLDALAGLRPWIGVGAFTFWVALHHAASDLYPRLRQPAVA